MFNSKNLMADAHIEVEYLQVCRSIHSVKGSVCSTNMRGKGSSGSCQKVFFCLLLAKAKRMGSYGHQAWFVSNRA